MCWREKVIKAVGENVNATSVIYALQKEWLETAKSIAGSSAKRALDIFQGLMFIESGQFILEILQNAEDARLELGRKNGFFRVELFRDKVVIEHDGKPFDERDVRNLCSISTSKKPSKGYKGYIGIGWKSVFKVSSKAEVHSNEYHFMFSKSYWFESEKARELEEKYGLKPEEVPWQVIPIPITPIEYIPQGITRFVIYLDNPSYYDDIARTLDELKPQLFLFLEYINRIEIHDRVKNKSRVIEWFVKREEQFDGVKIQEIIVNCYEDNQPRVYKFLVFKKTFKVPEEVRKDRVTIAAERGDVIEREVAIAFLLDLPEERVKPIEEGQFWGVYSFLPLHEVRSGLRFLIQADFIVHPGRRYINYEAMWNRWLMECIAEVVKTAIRYLALRFRKHYLEVFDYREVDDPFFHRLVKPTIVKIIDEELRDPEVLCIRGEVVRLSSTVKFDEAVAELIKQGLINEEDLKYIYGSERHFLDPGIKLPSRYTVPTLTLSDLLNKNLIVAKISKNLDAALELLASTYRLARSKGIYLWQKLVITGSNEIKSASEVYYGAIPKEVEDLARRFPEVREYVERLNFVHEKLAKYLGEDLIEWIGIKKVDFREICEKVLLPKIYADITEKPPPKEDLVVITALLKRAGLRPNRRPIWVVTASGEIRRSSDVYYPLQHFEPVEVFKELGVEFLDLKEYHKYDSDVYGWKLFFENALVKGLEPCEASRIHRDYITIINKVKERLDSVSDKNVHVNYLRVLKRLYGFLSRCWNEPVSIKVFTDDNRLVYSTECLLHDKYNPTEKWVAWRDRGFDIGPFISVDYIEDLTEAPTWRDFLVRALGVREEASKEDVERFALWYAERKLQERGYVIKVHKGEGYDLEAEELGKTVYVEVKGRKELGDIELTEKETQKAVELKDNYWLIVVRDIPNNPRAILVRNPASLLTKITISKKQLEESGEYLD